MKIGDEEGLGAASMLEDDEVRYEGMWLDAC